MSGTGAGQGAGAGAAPAPLTVDAKAYAMAVPEVSLLPRQLRVLPIAEQRIVDGRVFPLTLAPTNPDATMDELNGLVLANRELFLRLAMQHGAVLFRGFGSPSPEAFANFADGFRLKNFPYVGGAAPRTCVVRDVVFTTNESPPECPIPFHHEMAQVPTPPSYIMFFADVAPKVGGETPIIRSEHVCKFFFDAFPEFAAKVETLGVKYVRVMPENDDQSSPIGRSWKSTFQVETKEEAEAKMTELGSTWEWLEGGNVRTVTATVPALRVDPRTGRKMFFNSMVAAFTGWIDSRNDPTKAVLLGDGTPVDATAMAGTAKFMMANRVAFKWAAGDAILIDNTVTMHSRNPFERPRRILAALGGPSLDGFCVAPADDAAAAAAAGSSKPLSASSKAPAVTLARTGDQFPTMGLGVWKIGRDVAADTIVAAIKAGWRHFDCACDYGNEVEVGQGFARAFAEGLVTREELWITSKLWNTFHSPGHVALACKKTLRDLQLDYLDLYLIHFPIPQRFVPLDKVYPPEWLDADSPDDPHMEFASVPLHITWPAMEALVDSGLTRNIGVCNMGTAMLRDLLCYARVAPAVLQVEIHPFNTQARLLRFCKINNIAVTAFSPLGAGSYGKDSESVLREAALVPIAEAHGKSVAQVVLRWGLQRGCTVVAKTTKLERLVENLDVVDWELTAEEMAVLDGMDRQRRYNNPGEFCEEAFGTFTPIYE